MNNINDWIDEAFLVPKVVGKVKLRIVRTKILQFSSLEGEFEFEDDN